MLTQSSTTPLEQAASTNPEICKWCGEVREPVRYQVGHAKASTVPLCKNRCCPDCGRRLEVLTCEWVSNGKKGFYRRWTHVLPLTPGRCARGPRCAYGDGVQGREFTPRGMNPHRQQFCCDQCTDAAHAMEWRLKFPVKAQEIRKRNRDKERAKLVEHDRLKNVEGLDLKTGLRISLVAHCWIEGAETLYDMRRDIYPNSSDPFNAIKQLDRRFHPLIEDEKQRIGKLPDEQRRAEAVHLRARLKREEAKPKKV